MEGECDIIEDGWITISTSAVYSLNQQVPISKSEKHVFYGVAHRSKT